MLFRFLTQLWKILVRWLGVYSVQPTPRAPNFYKLKLTSFEDRSRAREALNDPRTFVLIGPTGAYKWAQMKCPCGCGEILAMNLMRSHYPRWEVEVGNEGLFTLSPSVDSKKCGAHFWVRDGAIVWCE